MQIEIINVGKPETPAGKQYQALEVAYKKEGKVEGKKLMDFANPAVFAAIQKFKQGDFVEVGLVKNEKGYWDWTGVTAATGASTAYTDVPPTTSGGANRESSKATVSNYETREERKERQQFIIRQSSIANALTFHDGKKASLADVLITAGAFVDYVNGIDHTNPFKDMVGDEDMVL